MKIVYAAVFTTAYFCDYALAGRIHRPEPALGLQQGQKGRAVRELELVKKEEEIAWWIRMFLPLVPVPKPELVIDANAEPFFEETTTTAIEMEIAETTQSGYTQIMPQTIKKNPQTKECVWNEDKKILPNSQDWEIDIMVEAHGGKYIAQHSDFLARKDNDLLCLANAHPNVKSTLTGHWTNDEIEVSSGKLSNLSIMEIKNNPGHSQGSWLNIICHGTEEACKAIGQNIEEEIGEGSGLDGNDDSVIDVDVETFSEDPIKTGADIPETTQVTTQNGTPKSKEEIEEGSGLEGNDDYDDDQWFDLIMASV